ncbi:hypothetical protein MOX02_24930 [Methylobacterium oxalidis]|uniref:Uncharacterized protein n=1 Tax=Methylobacterium oxalidis TaxID=944322 RepID=A0A512J3B7_9HYPH|nr:hypothetical protein MOX02_24930 [Methylobacterium oxalidis]GLS62827.1 hypothetical protein GCM10007888_12080 [Methylobacterium oxalidis]
MIPRTCIWRSERLHDPETAACSCQDWQRQRREPARLRGWLLVAVLTHLSDEYGDDAGMWFLEAGFGPVDHPHAPKFMDLDEAQDWITRKLAGFAQHGRAGGAP